MQKQKTTNSKQPKIGLALGSGGPKGLAHIGVLKVLEKNNIPIDFIAGASFGAMVGGFYAAGKDIRQAEEMALNANWKFILSLLDPSFGQGMIGGGKVRSFIEKNVGKTTFKKMKTPFAVVATDLKSGRAITMQEGSVASAIQASVSYPLVFKPVKRKGKLLADGGLSLPVPVEVVKKMGADLVIAVNLDARCFVDNNNKNSEFGYYKIANHSINLLRQHLAHWNTKEADIVIDPGLCRTNWGKFLDGKSIIVAGERATKKALPEIKKLIREKSLIL